MCVFWDFQIWDRPTFVLDLATVDSSPPACFWKILLVLLFCDFVSAFYGKQSRYNALAGKDASRAVAKMSLDPTDLNSDIVSLNSQYQQEIE